MKGLHGTQGHTLCNGRERICPCMLTTKGGCALQCGDFRLWGRSVKKSKVLNVVNFVRQSGPAKDKRCGAPFIFRIALLLSASANLKSDFKRQRRDSAARRDALCLSSIEPRELSLQIATSSQVFYLTETVAYQLWRLCAVRRWIWSWVRDGSDKSDQAIVNIKVTWFTTIEI